MELLTKAINLADAADDALATASDPRSLDEAALDARDALEAATRAVAAVAAWAVVRATIAREADEAATEALKGTVH